MNIKENYNNNNDLTYQQDSTGRAVQRRQMLQPGTSPKAVPIDQLSLPAHIYRALVQHSVETAGDLSEMTRRQVLWLGNIGREGIVEIEDKLSNLGLGFVPDLVGFLPTVETAHDASRYMDMDIGVLGFSARTHNPLVRANIQTVGDLVGKTYDALRQIRNLGPKSLEEIEQELFYCLGLELAQEPETACPTVGAAQDVSKYMDTGIYELDLSVRTYNVLHRANIGTVGDLASKTRRELMQIRNMGQKLLDEIEAKLEQFGLHLATELDVTREEVPEMQAADDGVGGSRGGAGVLEDLIAAAEGVKMEVPGGEGPGGRGEPGGR